MNETRFRLQNIGQAGGWRRLFVAGAGLLVPAAAAWAWLGAGKSQAFPEQLVFALSLWSFGAAALGLLLGLLAALDGMVRWVGAGFGLAPAKARLGLAAVLAGLTFLAALAQFLRYDVVMPAGGTLTAGELCVVLDRWTGEAKPCTDEALSHWERRRAEPRRAQQDDREEALWRGLVGLLIELLEAVRWLPGASGRSWAG